MTRERVRQELDLLRASAAEDDKLIAADLGVAVDSGPVLGAVDSRGCLHLLISMDDVAGLRADTKSPGLTIEPREYSDRGVISSGFVLDVRCGSPSQNDVFIAFAEDLCSALQEQPQNEKTVPFKTLEKWRRIFEAERAPGIARTTVVGIYGELVFLERLARVNADAALDAWTGPRGHRHDFTGSAIGVEVKTSEVSQAREIEIHGLEQLEPTPDAELYLAYFRIESNPSGVSPAELIQRCYSNGVSPDKLPALLDMAGLSGLQSAAEKFRVAESGVFDVDDGFPRLVTSDLKQESQPTGVTRVSYRVDLSAAPSPLDGKALDDLAVMVAGA